MKRILSIAALAACISVWISGTERPTFRAQGSGATGGYQGGGYQVGDARADSNLSVSSTLIMKLLGEQLTAPPSADKVNGLTVVGETYEAAAKENPITLIGRENGAGEYGKVQIASGQARLIQLSDVVNQLRWESGQTRGRVTTGRPFDWVTVERGGNGALHWTLLSSR